jgi:hypothetical protein
LLTALGAALLIGATVAGSSAGAQTDPGGSGGSGGAADATGTTPDLGGYIVKSRAAGVAFSYDSPGLIPGTPSPILGVSLPEASTNFSNGPSGYALASVLYPGALLSDLGPVVAEAGYDVPIPGYPIRTQAFYPSGPTTAEQTDGTARMASSTDAGSAQSLADHGALTVPGLISVGAMVSHSVSGIEDGHAVSRARVELHGVDILGGLVHIDALVTDLVATSDGNKAATAGTSSASGVKFLGLPATLDGTGVHLASQPAETPTTAASNPLGPLLDQLGAGKLDLSGLSPKLAPVVSGLNKLLGTVGGGAQKLTDLLATGGITITLTKPVETIDGAQGERLADGLSVTLDYDGHKTPVMSQLLALIPSEQLPSDPIPGVPLNTSPQALVEMVKAHHIFNVALGLGDVSTIATPAFELGPLASSTGGSGGGELPSSDLGTPGEPSPDLAGDGGQFTTPAPTLAKPSPVQAGPTSLISFGTNPLAVAASILLLLLIGAAAWFGATRLADRTLAAAGGACPEHLDAPPGGTS